MNDKAKCSEELPLKHAVNIHLDENLLRELIEVEQASETRLFGPFLARYASGSVLSVSPLFDAIDRNHLDDVATYSHKVKGIAAGFGLVNVAGIADAISAKAANGILPSNTDIESLAAAIGLGIAQLDAFVRSEAASNSA